MKTVIFCSPLSVLMNLLMSQKTPLPLLLLPRTGKNSFNTCSSKMSGGKKSRAGRMLVYPLTTTRHWHRPGGDEMSSSALFIEEMLQTPRAPDYNLQTLLILSTAHIFWSVVGCFRCNLSFQPVVPVWFLCIFVLLYSSTQNKLIVNHFSSVVSL